MEKIKVIMMSILMMLVSSVAFAQDNSVRGTVTDNSGEPIIGATIKVKGGAATLGTTWFYTRYFLYWLRDKRSKSWRQYESCVE